MKFSAASVVIILLVIINNSLVQGILETNDANHQCKCLKFSESVPLNLIKTIFISPPSGRCRKTEIIVTLKNEEKICMDPKCKWLTDVFKLLRRKKSSTSNVQRPTQNSR